MKKVTVDAGMHRLAAKIPSVPCDNCRLRVLARAILATVPATKENR